MIGTDIVKIERINELIKKPTFLPKVFTDREIAYFSSRNFNVETIAGAYASKEAFSKSICTGICGFSFTDIEVLHSNNGAPYLLLNDKLQDICNSKGYSSFDVSISHDGGIAVAVVIANEDINRKLFLKCIRKSDLNDKNIISYSLVKKILPSREQDSHKGTYGRCLAIGGSLGMTGAPVMACQAMLKSGAGLITLICAKSLNHIYEVCLKEVMTYPVSDEDGIILSENQEDIIHKTNSSDALCFGCGMGKHKNVRSLIRRIIKRTKTPIVIDADGINAISANIDVLDNNSGNIIITPHVGEFSRLTGKEIDDIKHNPAKHASEFACRYNVIVVLKSHRSVVAFPDGRVYENVLGNPGMATGGTGDVLAGVITSFCAQLSNIEDAALLGVYVHSLAADIAKEKVGEYSLTPTDIIENIANALKFL